MKPHDLLDWLRLLFAETAAAKFTGITSVTVHWNCGGVQKLELDRREVIK